MPKPIPQILEPLVSEEDPAQASFLTLNEFITKITPILGFTPSRATVLRWAVEYGMPYFTVPGSRRRLFKVDWLLNWIEAGVIAPRSTQEDIDAAWRRRSGPTAARPRLSGR